MRMCQDPLHATLRQITQYFTVTPRPLYALVYAYMLSTLG